MFEVFAQKLAKTPPETRALDLGCGTGIATRQLAEREYRVIGTDIDADMIQIAREQGGSTEYRVAQTSELPFVDAQFDAATAFSAFHWFSDSASVLQIRRVLKSSGIFMVVNKNDVAGFKVGYRSILAPFVEGTMPNAKKDYSPETTLADAGFIDIEKHVFSVDEAYSLDEALAYLRSVSLWNLVPESRKQDAANAIKNYCESEATEGVLRRSLEVIAIVGRN